MNRGSPLIRLILIVFLVFGQAPQAFSQDKPAEAQKKEYELSIDEAVELALNNSFAIQLAKYDVWIARTNKGKAESIYDTFFSADVGYRKNEEARTSVIAGTEIADNDYNIGLSKKLPTGTRLTIDQTNNRNATDSTFATNSVNYDSALKVELIQELGKNFFGLEDRGNVKITLLDIENAEHTSFKDIEGDVAEVKKAYWALVQAKELVGIAQGMVDQAKKLHDLHQEKLADGLVEAPEAIASEANYSERMNELKLAENEYALKSNALRLLLNIEDDKVKLVPTNTFDISDKDEILDVSLDIAFDKRHDYKAKRKEIEQKEIQLSIDKNNLWPEVNVTVSLERNGIGTDFPDAVKKITAQKNHNFFTGISINVPFGNSEARSAKKRAELEKAKSLLELKFLERKIIIGVMDQVRNSNTLREVANTYVQVIDLKGQKLEEETKRFNRGRSNTDTLIRFQEELLEANRRALEAQKNYYNALIDLKVEEGSLLAKYWQGEI